MNDFSKPTDVSDVDIAFPGNVMHLMPPYEVVKESNKRFKPLFSAWFFSGIKIVSMNPRDGIDEKKALRHIKAIMGSFEPQHEHKEAAVCFLLDKWFEDIQWEK